MSPTPVYEIVTFKLNPDVTPEALRAIAAKVDPAIRAFPGLLSRDLLHDEKTGEWVELCRWASLAQAEEAAQKVMGMPVFAPYFALMDPATITMRHLPIVPLSRAVPA
ncbi:MAG TPA: hypothetical protein VNZ52_13885 [Candidatus Thermoplasmatota archaeon]|nr:hypothetical protein [Candidatus Thermoplasmatota archaeon]